MKRVYDVIVLGAGPAGLAAAIELSRRKTDALLIEKGTWASPENKSWCTFESTIRKFGLTKAKKHKMPVITVDGSRISPVRIDLGNDPLWSLDEPQALRLLLARVRIDKRNETYVSGLSRRNNRVYVNTSRGEFVCRVLIDATGPGGVVRNLLHKPATRWSFLHCQIRQACSYTGKESCWAHYGERKRTTDPLFAGWMTPYSKDTIITGTYLVSSKNRSVKEHVRVIEEMVNDPRHRRIFAGSRVVRSFDAKMPLTAIEPVHDNIICVGDCWGGITPSTQEGVRPGLETGTIAARISSLCVKEGHFDAKSLNRYVETVNLTRKRYFENRDVSEIMSLFHRYLSDKEIKKAFEVIERLPNRVKVSFIRSEMSVAETATMIRGIFREVSVIRVVRRMDATDRDKLLKLLERYVKDLFEDELAHLVHKL